ncbi:MAG: phosphatase PAP2 family protein [Bacteroidetes bacterium]|nr:phosphatase PAP2 family protein [Bacteroidota bacterium]
MKYIGVFFLISLLCKSQNTDLRLLQSINAKNYPTWDEAMKGVSFSVYPAMPVTVGGIWINGYLKKDYELKRNAFKSASSIGLALAVASGLKYVVNRTRPYNDYPNEIIKRDDAGPYSFPSGHTTAAFSTATALSLTYKKWEVIVPSILYAGFVGYSRMRLGMHYPSDVLGGAVIGVGSGFLVWRLDKIIRKTQSSKKSKELSP